MQLSFLAIRQADVSGRILPVVGVPGDSFQRRSIFSLRINLMPVFGPQRAFAGILQFDDLTAFLFGAIHMQFYGLMPRVFLGLVFGYFYVWTGSLWVPVLAHFLNNGAAVIISFIAARGMIKTNYEDFGATDNIFLIAGSILFTTLLLYLVKAFSGSRQLQS